MSELHERFEEGQTVWLNDSIKEDHHRASIGYATLVSIDYDDERLPWRIRQGDQEFWARDESVDECEAPPTGSRDDLLDQMIVGIRNLTLSGGELLRLIQAVKLQADRERTNLLEARNRLEAQLQVLTEEHRAVPTGVCSACFEKVTYDRDTDSWEHEAAADHQPRAIVPTTRHEAALLS